LELISDIKANKENFGFGFKYEGRRIKFFAESPKEFKKLSNLIKLVKTEIEAIDKFWELA